MATYPESDSDIQAIYEARRDRLQHPDGKFDHAGRWTPSAREHASCCDYVYSPSRAHPYGILVHCRTRKHLQRWLLEHVTVRRFVAENPLATVADVMAEFDLSDAEAVALLRSCRTA